MNFKGMDPEQGRTIAGEISRCGTDLLTAMDEVRGVLGAVDWQGPDHDLFVEEWMAFVSGPVGEVGAMLHGKGDELMAHANEQEQASVNS